MTSAPTSVRPLALSRSDLPAYRSRLEDAWRHHVAEITRLSLDALDSIHAADGAGTTRIEQLAAATRMIAAERFRLEEAEAALRRIDDGTYGHCPQCGGPISVERLEVLPAARYCALCQR